MCVSVCVCVCVCVCAVASQRERDNKGGREREREMREVGELNEQTQCHDVLVHAVSPASFLQHHGILLSFLQKLMRLSVQVLAATGSTCSLSHLQR